jgi:anti-sigma factor RsiW
MTTHEAWTDRLSDYLDGELSTSERSEVDTHLRDCPACAGVLADLRRVVEQARVALPRPPAGDLWDGIAGRIESAPAATTSTVAPFPQRASRRVSFTLPQLAAAAAVLVAVSAGTAWRVTSMSGTRGSSADLQGRREPVESGENVVPVANVGMADAQYDAAVTDLEKALKLGRGRLDAATISVVEHNLQIIDQAISQAREALAADPANAYLSSHLVEARRRKLDLLRRAAALADTD